MMINGGIDAGKEVMHAALQVINNVLRGNDATDAAAAKSFGSGDSRQLISQGRPRAGPPAVGLP